ncbi:MAG: OsmC family protein [Desulfobacterota bacterium]|nr:OsmC family protein [Thermodesulfobacteriota bacterium]
MEGDIEDVDGVLRITKIRLTYQFKIPTGARGKAERALAVYADKCPAYQSVKGCIPCSWQAEMVEV